MWWILALQSPPAGPTAELHLSNERCQWSRGRRVLHTHACSCIFLVLAVWTPCACRRAAFRQRHGVAVALVADLTSTETGESTRGTADTANVASWVLALRRCPPWGTRYTLAAALFIRGAAGRALNACFSRALGREAAAWTWCASATTLTVRCARRTGAVSPGWARNSHLH